MLHGHRYAAEMTFEAPELDAAGRVIDFGVIREKLGGWLNAYWDHNTLLGKEDRALGDAIAGITGQTIYYLPYNPTAENMARYLLEHACPRLFHGSGLRCVRVRIFETPNCSADCAAVTQG